MKRPAKNISYGSRTVASKKGIRRRIVRVRPARSTTPSNVQLPKGLFSDLPHLVWMTDSSGQCIYINDTFSEFTGASPESFLKESWTRFLHPHDVAETAASWLASVRDSTSHQAQYRIRRHDNVYRWMLARAVPVKDASGFVTHWVGTNTDIHDLREKWDGLQKSGISEHDLMVTWAHDIRTPLTIARLKAEMTLLRRDDPQYVAENMNAIMHDVDRIDTMIKDLLDDKPDEAKGPAAAPQPTDLRDILSTSVLRLSALHPRRLVVTMPEQNVSGIWNDIAIQRALENLVGNAAKYGHADTPVTISLSCAQGRTTISVHNHGPALSLEAQRLIFGPYLRVTQPRGQNQEGWGLGLPMVKRIAEEHGGFVEVESSASQGTTFRVVLPLVEPN